MLEKKRPRVILLEDNDAILQSANAILSKEGWDVTCEQVSKTALQNLKQSRQKPFALFISNYKLPKMEGDDILEQVKRISPLTQRMLMIAAQNQDILINAINKAEINACISIPFKTEDLVQQSRICFRNFKREIKRQRLKRIVTHQNNQMFKIARTLKKKDQNFQAYIDKIKARLIALKSKQRRQLKSNPINSVEHLLTILDRNRIKPTPDNLKTGFMETYQIIQSLFDTLAAQSNIDPVVLSMDALFPEKPLKDHAPAPLKKDSSPGSSPSNSITDNSTARPLKSTEKSRNDDSATSELIENILNYALARWVDKKQIIQDDSRPLDTDIGDQTDDRNIDGIRHPLDRQFTLFISEDRTTAQIQTKTSFNPDYPPALSDILDWLSVNSISYGIIGDDAIETWLKRSCTDRITIAKGEAPVIGRPGIITYRFDTDFTNPGKITDDGKIDFRDRGDIPYVLKGTLLAQKTPLKPGKPGITIFGTPVPVKEVVDPVLVPGTGVIMSDDGLTIHADIDGQPLVDALGAVSVSPELVIQGDVDFETGNINFNGNIIVKGTIKEGFTVKGIGLTAQEIEGATIKLSGDLNVSAGITDSDITTRGNIHAKFINHSTIKGFKDLIVSKEIIDSHIFISGCCKNSTGHIISSKIAAKLGIEAAKIGTSASAPSHLKVGVEEHIETVKSTIDDALEISVNKSNQLKDELKTLENKDQALYQKISEKAHIQDRTQLDIKKIKHSLPELKKSRDMKVLSKASNKIQELIKKVKTIENELNVVFGTQDTIARRIEQIKGRLTLIEKDIKTHMQQKSALKEFSKKHPPAPFVRVDKTITQGTVIKTPHSSLIVTDDKSRCRIQEIESREEGVQFFKIIFFDL